VAPAVVLAVAKTTAAPTKPIGWTAYAPPGATVSPGTGYVTTATTDGTTAEKVAIKAGVKKWERQHPGGTCQITPADMAMCTTAERPTG
jgi:hypothetical protein